MANEMNGKKIARELGGINQNLTNLNAAIVLLREEMPCRSNDKDINPQARLTALETRQEEMRKRMSIVEKIGLSIVAVLTAVAAWFKAQGVSS